MIWSIRRMSSREQALWRFSVRSMSAMLGLSFPEGWLWHRMIEAALWSNACLSIVLLSIAVLVSVPLDSISVAMTPLQEVRNITQASSWSSP